jgi:hypothetical protein
LGKKLSKLGTIFAHITSSNPQIGRFMCWHGFIQPKNQRPSLRASLILAYSAFTVMGCHSKSLHRSTQESRPLMDENVIPSPERHNIATQITVALVSDGEAFCSGVLIDLKTVLTAAHCVEDLATPDGPEIRVYFGNLTATQPRPLKTNALVKSIEIHPDYDKNLGKHDLAKLFLKEPFSSKIILPRFPTDKEIAPLKAGSRVYSWGYGTASDQDYTPEKHQFAGSIQAINPQIGTMLVKNFISNSKPGDSGAPVFLDDCRLDHPVLIGVNIGEALLTPHSSGHSYFVPLHLYGEWLTPKNPQSIANAMNQAQRPKPASRGWFTWWRASSACLVHQDPPQKVDPNSTGDRQTSRFHPRYLRVKATQTGKCINSSFFQKSSTPVFF